MQEEPTVHFGTVQITQYKREIGGSCGVPEKGKYPLGLSFEVIKTQEMPFSTYVEKYQKKAIVLEEVGEKKRKKLLGESKDQMTEYDYAIDKEMQETMKRIHKRGCKCKGVCDKNCACVKNGHSCIFGVCSCSDRDCANIRDDDPCIGSPFDDIDAGQKGILLNVPPSVVKKPGLFN
ncbi:CXC domain-containing protein [Entamoeba marina]